MMNKKYVDVVNIVGSGKLKPELDLAAVSEDMQNQEMIAEVEHSHKNGNRLLIYFSGNEVLGILSPSAVYIFNGVDNFEELNDAKQKLLTALTELEIISNSNPPESQIAEPFEIQNVVCTGDFDRELNLEALSIGLGLEDVEYEPEQFPGLIYKSDVSGSTILIFASGKIVITGVNDRNSAQEAFDSINTKVSGLFE
jgi:transcription initiation factor TFIID TATA-box-binding protein